MFPSVFVSTILNGVTSFFSRQQRKSKLLAGFLYAMAESWKNLKDTTIFLLFSTCLNRKRSALVHDLLSNKSQFVGQL